jgi:tetratricopeptide (TPR) repeat protein
MVERAGTDVRYRQLETIRQFAAAQLADTRDAAAVHARHARWFAAESDRQFAAWRSPRQRDAYQWLDAELPNLRAALRWASGHGEIDAAVRIASNIGDMARFRLRDEAAGWAAELVDRARAVHHPRLIVLLTWAASTAWSVGQLADARRYGEQAVSLLADGRLDPFVWAFADLAMVASYQGDQDRAVALAEAGARHPADAQDRFCTALLPFYLALAGRAIEAQRRSVEAIPVVEETGVPSSIAFAHWAMGKAFAGADPARAVAAYEQALVVARASGNRFLELTTAADLAALQAQSGDPARALRSFRDVIGTWRRSPDLMFASHGLGSLIVLLARIDRLEPAAILHGAVVAAAGSSAFAPELTAAVERLRDRLGAASFDEYSRRGARLELHEAHDVALREVHAALAALGG